MARYCLGRLIAAFFILWATCCGYFVYVTIVRPSESDSSLHHHLESAKMDIRRIESENKALRNLLKEIQETEKSQGNDDKKSHDVNGELHQAVSRALDGPSLKYEVLRRQTKRDVKEMWWYVRSNLESILGKKGVTPELETHLKNMIADTQHHEKAVLADLHHLFENDGFKTFRHREAQDLSDLVQKRIYSLQNPKDCQSAKKLLCNLNKGCGYGCQIHHAIYCFIVAYGTERMLVLKSKGWRYDKAGFEDVFLPLSDTCPSPKIGTKKNWPGNEDTEIVELGIVDSVHPRPQFLPPSIPKDLADRIIRLHGDPIVWWISQFLKYMLRPQPHLTEMLKSTEEAQRFAHPIVGIHIRRTDKVGTEAAYHSVEEYMKYVEEYYQELEVRDGSPAQVKRVYVASDDTKVLSECKKKFPDYVFIGDSTISKSAAVSSRYTMKSLQGIITDIHMLSISDHLVCTFSSQVCRIAYEIMQTFHPDASDRFKSLDDIWYYGGQDEHQQVAIMDHSPRSKQEMDLQKGDVIAVAGNHWNGYNKGKNHRNNRVGLYPEYKTKENYKIVEFPTYPHVGL